MRRVWWRVSVVQRGGVRRVPGGERCRDGRCCPPHTACALAGEGESAQRELRVLRGELGNGRCNLSGKRSRPRGHPQRERQAGSSAQLVRRGPQRARSSAPGVARWEQSPRGGLGELPVARGCPHGERTVGRLRGVAARSSTQLARRTAPGARSYAREAQKAASGARRTARSSAQAARGGRVLRRRSCPLRGVRGEVRGIARILR